MDQDTNQLATFSEICKRARRAVPPWKTRVRKRVNVLVPLQDTAPGAGPVLARVGQEPHQPQKSRQRKQKALR